MGMVMTGRYQLLVGVLVSTFCVLPSPVKGQTSGGSGEPPDRTPPGFALMDGPLMSIETIDPLQSATLTTFSTVANGDLIPRDIGIEFVPMLFMHVHNPPTVWEAYQQLYSGGASVPAQYLAISVAFSQTNEPTTFDARLAHVAVAARTFFLAGKPNSRLQRILVDLSSKSKDLGDELQRQSDPGQREDAERRAGELLAESRALLSNLARVSKNRVGWMLEGGAAFVADVPNNALRDGQVRRFAVWATPLYRFDRWDLAIAGLGRGIHFPELRHPYVAIFDTGGRVSWVPPRLDFTLTMESLGRHRYYDVISGDENRWSGRIVGGVSRSVGRSGQISFTFGKNYRDDFIGSETLVASFALKIAMGDLPVDIAP